jgi:hypothetical protein
MKNNKEPNFVPKLEKAIMDKYGEIATRNPSYFWDEEKEKAYLEQLKKENEKPTEYTTIQAEGFFIKKKLFMKANQRTCPQCGNYSFDSKDDLYINKFETCFKCFVLYVEGREEKWLKKKHQ